MKIIRFKGLIPFLVIVLAGYVFAVYYLDLVVKNAVIKQGTKINGALVDVDRLTISFRKSRFEIRGLRATQPSDLMKNRLDIGALVADFQFLPLLKKKVIIDNVAITDVRWGTERRTPGAIPAGWQRQWDEEAKQAKDSLVGKALASLQSQVVAQLPKVDIDKLVERFDPREWVKLEELTTYQRATALPDEITTFAYDWHKKGSDFIDDQGKKISNYRKQIESLDPRKFKSALDVVKAIETVQGFEKELDQHKDSVTDLVDDAKQGVAQKVAEIKGLRTALENDIDSIKAKIGFGDLDVREMSQSIFGPLVIDRYQQFLTHYEKGRRILGALKGKEQPKPVRHQGRNVHYPVTDNIPRFLLAKVDLSADTRQNQEVESSYRGYYGLKAADITSDPKLVGRPMEFDVNAEMRSAGFARAELKATIDRTREVDHDRFSTAVSGIKMAGVAVGHDDFFVIPLKSGLVNLQASFDLAGETMRAYLKADLAQLVYNFNSQGVPPLVEVIQDVIRTLDAFDVEASLSGTLEAPKMKIRSSFDDALASGIKKVLLAKLDKAKQQLETYLRQEIGAKIALGEKLLNAKKAQVLGQLESQLKSVVEVEKLLDKRLAELKREQQNLLKKEIQGKIPKLPAGKLPELPKVKLPF